MQTDTIPGETVGGRGQEGRPAVRMIGHLPGTAWDREPIHLALGLWTIMMIRYDLEGTVLVPYGIRGRVTRRRKSFTA